jgi:hypothetical protein
MNTEKANAEQTANQTEVKAINFIEMMESAQRVGFNKFEETVLCDLYESDEISDKQLLYLTMSAQFVCVVHNKINEREDFEKLEEIYLSIK